LVWLVLCAQPAPGQLSSTAPTSSTSSTPAVSRTLRGSVANALTGAAIPRVLVQVGTRSVLTDSQGRFELPDFTDSQAYVVLSHPQFSQTNDPFQTPGRQRIPDLDAVAALKMYPDAVITGVVSGGDGLALAGVPVQLLRQNFNPQSGLIMQPVKFAQTNLSGEYRFRVPSGRFSLTVAYLPRTRDSEEGILPVSFPENTAGNRSSYFEVTPGEEKHIDLRPRTGPLHSFQVRLDGVEGERAVQFEAVTPTNETIDLGSPGQSSPGVFQPSLPQGTYTLYAQVVENRNSEMTGSSRVTVTGNQSEPAIIHLEPATSLPVELSVDTSGETASTSNGSSIPASTTQSIPSVTQFNLSLIPAVSSGWSRSSTVRQREDKTYEFRVTPGRYRLSGNGGGAWYVESATYGVTDLLTSDIVISSGGSGAPIRLVVNNIYGSVTGTVQFPNATDPVWVYLIPTTPTLAPVNPITINNLGSGTANFTSRAPAGDYLAVELDHRVTEDLHNPEVVARFSSSAKPVTISAAAAATVNLDIATQPEAGK
jgi:hypothetical protein